MHVLLRLLGIARSLLPIMAITITTGVCGFLCAISLSIIGAQGILTILDLDHSFSCSQIFLGLLICGVLRSFFGHCEQYSGHYIAFKLLAVIRDSVFSALRRLCPAKLEVRDKGNLISLITSDVELLEVFYAHTIAPISIALITCAAMVGFIASYSYELAGLAVAGYFIVGVVIPLSSSGAGRIPSRVFRQEVGAISSYVLDSLRGLRETIQFNDHETRLSTMCSMLDSLSCKERRLKIQAGIARGFTDSVILAFSLAAVLIGISRGLDFNSLLIVTVTLMSSFGPVVALSKLTGSLNQTIASAERVLGLIDEEPEVAEVVGGVLVDRPEVECRNLGFGYGTETILDSLDLRIPEHSLVGISGKSGSGKSTLLRLFMRFWNKKNGSLMVGGRDIDTINTKSLRELEAFLTQDTVLFHDTIEENIRIAKLQATREEVVEAAKKAAIHDFVMSLPKGYETDVGELGDRLSGGERQRIGLARAFLHGARLLLLDEPSSNLDSLNEAIILRSIVGERQDRTVVLVSHRESTMRVADSVFNIENYIKARSS
jgi:ABC-type multidrug transport system fused ATPase/permease subunit